MAHENTLIGNYCILSELAFGSFGRVYLAQHAVLTNRIVALKLMPSTPLNSEDERKQFLQEAHILEMLQHPHILPILDVGIHEGLPYIVSEYALRGSLRDLLQRQSSRLLPVEKSLSILMQIGQALDHAHRANIIHRDVKPENILFNAKGEALLADFGLAITLASVSVKYAGIAGTPRYMAPEQFQGTISRESDQYALGCIAYELFTGQPPFAIADPIALLFKHSSEAPVPPTQLSPSLPPSIERTILKALAKQRQHRFPSINAFITALCAPINATVDATNLPTQISTPAVSRTPSAKNVGVNLYSATPAHVEQNIMAAPPVRTPDAYHHAELRGQAAAHPVYTSAPGAPVVTRYPHGAVQTPLPAQHINSDFSPASSPPRVTRRKVAGGLLVLAMALGGGLLWLEKDELFQAFTAPTSIGPAVPQGTKFYSFNPGFGQICNLAWSPDGLRIASGCQNAKVPVWDAASGKREVTYTGHSDSVYSVAWSPDGTRIVSGGHDGTAQVWDAYSAKHILTYEGHSLGPNQHLASNSVNSVAWSPGGNSIASAGYDTIVTVQVWDANSGSLALKYTGHTKSVRYVAWSPNGQSIASCGDDASVQVWRAKDGQLLQTYRGHTARVWALAWSPDGKRIASASDDTTVQVWEVDSGQHIYTYAGTSSNVDAIAWSHDGKWLAAAYYDRTVQVWDASTGKGRYIYTGHRTVVSAVTWSSTSTRIVSGSTDGEVQVWQGA